MGSGFYAFSSGLAAGEEIEHKLLVLYGKEDPRIVHLDSASGWSCLPLVIDLRAHYLERLQHVPRITPVIVPLFMFNDILVKTDLGIPKSLDPNINL